MSGDWLAELTKLIQESRRVNNDQRFGQLLFNVLARADGREGDYDENFHTRLFYIEDYELAGILQGMYREIVGVEDT